MAVFGPAVLVGHVAASVLRNAFAMLLTFGVALALGFRPTADAAGWAGAVGLLLLFVLAMSWLSALVGLLVRSVEAASAFGFALLFLPYISSAFVPIATLPGWLQPFAEGQPITPINEAVRGLFFELGSAQVGAALVWCVGILIASIAGCTILWRRAVR
jgi:ABC-2 type transport system permease protein